MGTHFFHFDGDKLTDLEWDTASDGKPTVKLESKKEEVHIFFDREQLEKLAMSIHRYLILTDAREKALAKAMPNPPEEKGSEVWL